MAPSHALPPRTQCEPQDVAGLGSAVRGEQSGRSSRRTAMGWAPCVRGEQYKDCAGKADARTASCISREILSDSCVAGA